MTELGHQATGVPTSDATHRVPKAEPISRNSFRSVWLSSLGIALLACMLSLLRYSPPFEKWMTYDYTIGRHYGEMFRAHSIEQQLKDPLGFAPVTSDRVLTWRLLPVLPAHYLGVPFRGLLAFGWAGALVLVWYCCSRLPATSLWWERFSLAVLVATSSVFFVSTGWLAYFDAWWIFALCLVTFSPSTAVLVTATALAPWIDERFLIGLPVAFAARALVKGLPVRECGKVLGWLVLGVAPYVVLRMALWGESLNHGPAELLSERSFSVVWKNPLGLGTWEGMRAGWLLVLCLVPFVARGRQPRLAFLAIASVVTLVASFYVADDLSRSASILMPGVLALIIVAKTQASRMVQWSILGAAALNMTLPAVNVVARMHAEISTLPEVMTRMQTWKEDILVKEGNQTAVQMMLAENFEYAFWLLLDANREDPHNVPVLHNLARAADLSGHNVRAAWAYRRLIDENPTDPGPMLYLAQLCERLGDSNAARIWTNRALAHAGTDWPKREKAQQLLERLGPAPGGNPQPVGG